jgi:hypothetical protein
LNNDATTGSICSFSSQNHDPTGGRESVRGGPHADWGQVVGVAKVLLVRVPRNGGVRVDEFPGGSVGGRELDGLSLASLACGEGGHRGLGEVAAGDGPLVVLIGEDGADEADRGGGVGEDPDDVGASLDLLAEPFD